MVVGAAAQDTVNILLVDDQLINLTAAGAVLERPDYRIVTASSGAEALSRILKEDFALILLDVVMPGMDGFEVATTVKQRDRSKLIPIIFMTANRDDVDAMYRGYSVGAVDYLIKPLNPELVRAKVAVFAELHRQKRQIERQALLLQENERRESERQLAELSRTSSKRYKNLAEAVPLLMTAQSR